MNDLLIIGAGPAGLSAGIYAVRYGLKTLVIGEVMGGLLSQNWVIENYPGCLMIRAFDLANKMLEQAKSFGIEIANTSVTKIDKVKEGFEVSCGEDTYQAKAVIIASGTERRKLNIPGETELTGKGVSYCFNCDGPLFKGKVVAVVGGGDSAVRAARDLSEIAEKVYLIHRRNEFRAKPEDVSDLRAKINVEFLLEENVLEFLSDDKYKSLSGVKLSKGNTLAVKGVFIEIGGIPSSKFTEQLGLETENSGYIKVDENMKTNVTGVFAAGDVTNGSGGMQQIVTSTSEGAISARAAYRYLSDTKKGGF